MINISIEKEWDVPIVTRYIIPTIYTTRFHPDLVKKDAMPNYISINLSWWKWNLKIKIAKRKV